MKKTLNFAIFWSKVAQNDGRGNLEISNMQFLFIRILSITQMEASVKWAQKFLFAVPPTSKPMETFLLYS